MNYRISIEAKNDIEKIWFYTFENWSIEQADRYFDLIMDEIEYFAENPASGKDFSSVFNQYLRTTKIPVLEYYFKGNKLFCRWNNVVDNFFLPIKIANKTIIPSVDKWKKIRLKKNQTFELDKNYFINYKEVKEIALAS